jgi:hypothetical protein
MSRGATGLLRLVIAAIVLIIGLWRLSVAFVGPYESYLGMQWVPAEEHPAELDAKYEEVSARLAAGRGGDVGELTKLEGELAKTAELRGRLKERWNKKVRSAAKLEFLLGAAGVLIGCQVGWNGWKRVRRARQDAPDDKVTDPQDNKDENPDDNAPRQ